MHIKADVSSGATRSQIYTVGEKSILGWIKCDPQTMGYGGIQVQKYLLVFVFHMLESDWTGAIPTTFP